MTANPAVLSSITSDDIRGLARLHIEAFPNFFLSVLGETFLVQFYRGFLNDPSAVTVVARDGDGRAIGAVVGTTEPAGFFRRLLRRRWAWFAIASAGALLRHPSAAPRLVRATRYRGSFNSGESAALLSSICVDPSVQRSGVGGQLIDAWTNAAARRGASHAVLSTDTSNNEKVNRFYVSRGWKLAGGYSTPEGRQMTKYEKVLDH